MAIEGEALLAAVGLDAVMSPGKLRITVAHRERAEQWSSGALIRREIRRFLNGDHLDEAHDVPAFDYMELLDKFAAPVDVTQLEDKIAGNDHNEAMALIMAASDAAQYLNGIIPKRTRVTALGPSPMKPSDSDVVKFKWAYAAIERPLTVLKDLNEGDLMAAQVTAFAAVYPALYDLAKTQVFLALADLKAARPKLTDLPARKDQMLQVLLQTRTFTPELMDEMQKAFGQADAKDPSAGAPKGGGKLDVNMDNLQTPTERVAYK